MLSGQGQAQTNSLADLILASRLLNRPIVPTGPAARDNDETAALAAAAGLLAPQALPAAISSLECFPEIYPNSPWAALVHANLAKYYFDLGRYALALKQQHGIHHPDPAQAFPGRQRDPPLLRTLFPGRPGQRLWLRRARPDR